MKSVLTVVTPAANQDLTSLANVKAELGISGSTEDTNIATWIDQASSVIAAACNRVFGSETVRENFRASDLAQVVLQRSPVSSLTSVVENGTTLVANTDFILDPDNGVLTRLSGDYEVRWCFRTLVVTYVTGYSLLTGLPDGIERAAVTLVKQYRSAAARDPLLKSEEIPGVLSQTFWVGGTGDKSNGIPHEVETLIAPYREVAI